MSRGTKPGTISKQIDLEHEYNLQEFHNILEHDKKLKTQTPIDNDIQMEICAFIAFQINRSYSLTL
jgi:hypothetical protein